MILLVRAVDTIDLRRVIFGRQQSMPEVLDTQTFLVFEGMNMRYKAGSHATLRTPAG